MKLKADYFNLELLSSERLHSCRLLEERRYKNRFAESLMKGCWSIIVLVIKVSMDYVGTNITSNVFYAILRFDFAVVKHNERAIEPTIII